MANSADFTKGQKDGLVGTAIAMIKVIDGTDTGANRLANPELEKIRRVYLSWRDFLIENKDAKDATGKKIEAVLINTRKIMEA